MLPRLIFKYKPITSLVDLQRVIDIIKNNKLFIPNRTELNDPLEGQGFRYCPGYAGCSMYIENDLEDPVVKEILNRYRILSLSANGFSPQLWAHYANTYSGICFCYRTDKSFNKIQKVIYSEQKRDFLIMDKSFGDLSMYFLNKEKGWDYEEEWRIVRKSTGEDKSNFFNYDSEDLACVIIGNQMDSTILEILLKYIPKNVPVLKAKPGYESYKTIILPIDYEYQNDGSKVDGIYDVNDLVKYLERENK